MVDVTMQGISIGPIEIRFYALALISGVIVGMVIGRAEARRRGLDPEFVYEIVLWGVVAGLVGARLYHVLDTRNIDRYLDDPLLIFAVWRGGLGIYGALIGVILAAVVYTRLKRQPTLVWMDVAAPAFLAGQAIGRWGNFFNEELFGRPTDLPWGIPIPQRRVAAEAPQYLGETHFHPLFLYESILSAIGVLVMLFVARRFAHRVKPGDIVLLYFAWYPATRFTLEFLRASKWEAGGLSVAQIVSLPLVVIAVAILAWRHRRDFAHIRQS